MKIQFILPELIHLKKMSLFIFLSHECVYLCLNGVPFVMMPYWAHTALTVGAKGDGSNCTVES